MPRKTYNKLVRDHIPEIIAVDDRAYGIDIMNDDTYRQALLAKLVEEAIEASEADEEHLAMELADLLEVMDSLIELSAFSKQDVLDMQLERRTKRGGFTKRIKLLWTE